MGMPSMTQMNKLPETGRKNLTNAINKGSVIGHLFGLVSKTMGDRTAPSPQQKQSMSSGLTSNQANTTKKRRSILAGGVSGGGATVLGRSNA